MSNKNQSLWEEIFKKKEWGKYPSEPITKHFYKVSSRKDIKILELSVGGGANISYMVGTFGLDEDKNLGYPLCNPTQGSYANTGIIGFATKEDMTKLYGGQNYEITHFYEIQTLDENVLIDGLFITEGIKKSA